MAFGMTSTAFEIQFPGGDSPVAFVPGGGTTRVGAITANPEWS